MPSPPPISPISGARLKALRLLQNKKHRLESGTCLIEGRRFVTEAMARPGIVEALLLTREAAASPEGGSLLAGAHSRGIAVNLLSDRQLGELSDTVNSQGIIALIRVPSADPESILPGAGPSATLVALDGVSDPGNVGTIVRTCAWFGASGLLLSEGSVELSNPKLLRSTMGAIFALPVAPGVDLRTWIPCLKREGYRALAAEAGAAPARKLLAEGGKRILLFGSEAHGLSAAVRSLADASFGIPGTGAVESLNVSVAVGVSLEIAFSGRG